MALESLVKHHIWICFCAVIAAGHYTTSYTVVMCTQLVKDCIEVYWEREHPQCLELLGGPLTQTQHLEETQSPGFRKQRGKGKENRGKQVDFTLTWGKNDRAKLTSKKKSTDALQAFLLLYPFCSDSWETLIWLYSEKSRTPRGHVACPPDSRDWWGCQSNAKRLTPIAWHFHGNCHLRKSPLYQIFKKNTKIKAERTNKSMFDMPRVQSRFLRDTSLPFKWWAILLSKQLHKTSALHHSSSQGLEGAGKKWCSLKKKLP